MFLVHMQCMAYSGAYHYLQYQRDNLSSSPHWQLHMTQQHTQRTAWLGCCLYLLYQGRKLNNCWQQRTNTIQGCTIRKAWLHFRPCQLCLRHR